MKTPWPGVGLLVLGLLAATIEVRAEEKPFLRGEFVFPPDQVGAIITYLHTLEDQP